MLEYRNLHCRSDQYVTSGNYQSKQNFILLLGIRVIALLWFTHVSVQLFLIVLLLRDLLH